MTEDPAIAIAAEHVSWCRQNGVSTADINRQFGDGKWKQLSWDDAVWVVACAWDRLGITENCASAIRRAA